MNDSGIHDESLSFDVSKFFFKVSINCNVYLLKKKIFIYISLFIFKYILFNFLRNAWKC